MAIRLLLTDTGGEIYVNPTEQIMNEYVKYQNEDIRSIDNIDFINAESVRTKDNVEISHRIYAGRGT